ncbi:MAG TPA: SDR family NAD(P)-dependent oxidoreductase, partial [Thermoanaerobaculia bacterium]|nr:SDR family NAD(P)-dependent oxidoreductase [Thermoanaerobaculia bacterium]
MQGRVLITGAAGALGRSVVQRFLDGGDRVLAVDANEAALAELTDLAPSDRLSVRRVNLADSGEVERLFDDAGKT